MLYVFTHPNAFLININYQKIYKINYILFNQLIFINNDLLIRYNRNTIQRVA